MMFNYEKYLEFGKTLTKEEQQKFVDRVKQIMLAIEISPDLLKEGIETLFKEYPKFKECYHFDD